MADPFEAYAKAAHSRVSQPQPLIGVNKTRAAARERYSEITTALAAFRDPENLEIYLLSIDRELAQFRAELPFLWEGEDDFLGLEKEIERAQARVDDGLDFPRYEVKELGK